MVFSAIVWILIGPFLFATNLSFADVKEFERNCKIKKSRGFRDDAPCIAKIRRVRMKVQPTLEGGRAWAMCKRNASWCSLTNAHGFQTSWGLLENYGGRNSANSTFL
jgi:hypothetical protein